MTSLDVSPGGAGPNPQEPVTPPPRPPETPLREPVGTSLRHDRTAMTFWAGESISLIGSQVTTAVLPLLARESLGGSGRDIGLLQFFLFLPYLALPLLVGVWVDRHRKRPLMISTNLIRLVLVLTVPLPWWSDALTLPALYLVAFVLGIATVCYEVAALAYFPRLIGRERLAEGNTWMMASNSTAGLVGPGLGGILVQVLRSPPVALLVDAFSYVASLISLMLLRRDEPPLTGTPARRLSTELKSGLQFIAGNPIIRGISLHGLLFNAGSYVVMVSFLVKSTSGISGGAGVYGAALSAAGAGALLGAARSRRFIARVGYGRGLAWSAVIASVPLFLIAAVDADRVGTTAAVFIWGGCYLVTGFGEGMFNVMSYTVRQAMTPDDMLGRMSAALRLLLYAGIPSGSLIGGLLVDRFGASWAVAAGAALMVISIPPLWAAIRLRDLPTA